LTAYEKIAEEEKRRGLKPTHKTLGKREEETRVSKENALIVT